MRHVIVDLNHPVMTNTEGYNVSERYQVINTMDVVNEFERFGFELASVEAGNVRDLAKIGKGKHMVRMTTGEKLFGEMRPEVIINNSYDGTKALNIRIGMFRFVCSNGMIVGHNLLPNLQIMHSRQNWQEAIMEFIDTYEEKYNLQKEWIAHMRDARMSLDQAYAVAEKALKIRHYDQRINNDAVDPLELLLVKRSEDKGDSAWLRYNVMQEHLVNGEYKKYGNDGSIHKAKILTNVDELVRFNVELSDLFANEIIV